MEITTFFAGPSDDLDYPAMREWVAAHLGTTDLKLAAATQPRRPSPNSPPRSTNCPRRRSSPARMPAP